MSGFITKARGRMASPVIGVPLMGTSLARRYMQGKYTRCLRAAGAKVKILDPVPGEAAIARYLEECGGFLFPGGADIDPRLYGQEAQPGCGEPNPVRDGFEFPLISAVLAADKPLLCICRGMQLLNVARGGTLTQDIKPIQKYNHADLSHRTGYAHPVELEAGSLLLAKLFAGPVIRVNSLHHQAVDRLGDGLLAAARSPEGFVEAIECPARAAFTLGVQWHPEHMRDPSQRVIFAEFVSACAESFPSNGDLGRNGIK